MARDLAVRRNDEELQSWVWEPFAELSRLSRRVSRLVDMLPWADGDGFTPTADVEETDEAYIVELELPGVKKGDISVEASDRRLVVRGERREQARRGILRRRGRVTGHFHYELSLPGDLDVDRIEARLEDGVLTLQIPKSGKE